MIAELIPKVAAMGQEKEHKFRPRPSSAGPERCIRQMVYHGLEFPHNPLPGRAVLVFDDSSWHEELTGDWIRKTSFQLHSEQMRVKCRPPMDIDDNGGHRIDGIITDLLGVDRLFEHKAINHFTFNKYWNGELPLDHFAQSSIYIDAIQRDSNPNLKEIILLIKNKNTAQYMEFLCSYEWDTLTVISKAHSNGEISQVNHTIQNIVSDSCEKFNRVLYYIERKTLPKRQYDIDHWRCDYCQYNHTCWGDYEKEFLELETNAMLPNEVADLVRYSKELAAHRLEMSKEEKELKGKIISIMKEVGAREGKAGEYICELKLTKTHRIDKQVIPQNILDQATQISQYEKLNIRKAPKAKETT